MAKQNGGSRTVDVIRKTDLCVNWRSGDQVQMIAKSVQVEECSAERVMRSETLAPGS